MPPFAFDPAILRAAALAQADAYADGRPFPHAVLDGLVPPEVVDAAADEFPAPDAPVWRIHTEKGNADKLASADGRAMGPVCRQLVAQFNSGAMVDFLEALTGIEGLIPDPHLVGGGMHRIERGGFLAVHADFNRHSRLQLDRRLNLILYLNRGWREEWGGALELWNGDMSACEQRIAPLGGRIVVFPTTSTSYHGHPEPVTGPEGLARRSLAFFYYTNGRPATERRPAHTTLYQAPGRSPRGPGAGAWAREQARRRLPPRVVRFIRRTRGGYAEP